MNVDNLVDEKVITFEYWKRVFLGYICAQPKCCLDKNKFTKNCWYCIKTSDAWIEQTMHVDEKDITLVAYYGNECSDYIQNVSPQINEVQERGWSPVAFKQHPLVNSGDAYWIGNLTLLTGYTLNGMEVHRPVFSYKREKSLCKVRNTIKKYVGKYDEGIIGNGFIRKKRQHLVRQELLGIEKLSIDIIIFISEWI